MEAPQDPAQTQPEASSSSLRLESLPIEVLERIVEAVAEFPDECQHCDLPLVEPEDLAAEDHSACSPLRSLRQTSKLFLELCNPLWWQAVDLDDATTSELEKFAQCNLKYSRYFRELALRIHNDETERADRPSASCANPDLEVKRKLFYAILAAAPNVEKLNIDFDFNTRTKLLPLLARFAPTLTELCLGSNMKEAMDEMHVASMIDCLPLLDTVVLQRVDWSWVSKKDGTDGLCKSLRALERLRTLDLFECQPLNDSWATHDWLGAIETLELACCPKLTQKGFEALVARFKSSLKQLGADATPYPEGVDVDEEEDEPGEPLWLDMEPYDLPHLKSLKLGYLDIPAEYLARFKNCKLHLVHLAEPPLQFDTEEFLAFLDTHRATLVKLTTCHTLSRTWANACVAWCEAHNVEWEESSESEDESDGERAAGWGSDSEEPDPDAEDWEDESDNVGSEGFSDMGSDLE